MVKIFVSYSRKDEAFARQLAEALTEMGANVWIDQQGIHAGSRWGESIQQALDSCDLMLLVLSPDSMSSTNVGDEWGYYLDHKKPIIPVMHKPCKVHFQLSRLQYVDFHVQAFYPALRQLHIELKRQGFPLDPLPPTRRPSDKTKTLEQTVPLRASLRKPQTQNWTLPAVGLLAVFILLVIISAVLLADNGDNDNQADLAEITEEPTESATLTETPSPTTLRLPTGTAAVQVFEQRQTTSPTPNDTQTVEAFIVGFETGTATSKTATAAANVSDVSTPQAAAQIVVQNQTTTPTPNNTETTASILASWTANPQAGHATMTAIAIGTPTVSGEIVFSSDRDDNLELYLLDVSTGTATRLTDTDNGEAYPAWSPDGSAIAFQHFEGGSIEIFRLDLDDNEVVNLSNNPEADESAAWSPDGRYIAFTSHRDNDPEIYRIDADGGNPTRLTNASGYDQSPDWSPDGSLIAFTSDESGNQEIYLLDEDGNTTNISNSDAIEDTPVWSPDGRHIAFVSDQDGSKDIYVMEADGSNLFRLTDNAAIDYSPAWSPDGRHIAFVSDRDGNYDIYSMEADGSNPVNLTNNPADDQYPAWRPSSGE